MQPNLLTDLQESEARFRAAFQSSAIGMGLLSLDGRILQVNDAVLKISGYTEVELLQRYDYENVFPSARQIGQELYRELLDGKRVDDFSAGNIAATMAWSGDVLYYQLGGGYPNLEWIFPEDGAFLWTDNMMIPTGAAHPVSALQLIDFFYRPDVATMVQEWVLYMSPCSATQEQILADADAAEAEGSKGYADKLRATAENPYLFPSDELLANASFGRQLENDDEKAEWDSIFEPISEGG